MLEVLLDNKNGNVWDLSEIVDDVTWKTTRIGRAASVEISFVRNGVYQARDFQYNNGDIVRVRYGGANVFYGYVFDIGSGKDEQVKITAYDQLRYLMAKDTYVFSNSTATQVIKRIASDFGLQVGYLAETGHRIRSMLEDNQTLMDIIWKALALTLKANGVIYNFYDDFGKLALRDARDMVVDVAVGDDSLMYDFSYSRSIDGDTFNRVKLVRDNKQSGKRDVYIAQDSASIAKWGRLQLYETVDENANAAQINELLNNLLALKNREQKRLQIDGVGGDVQIRAGCYVPIIIAELGIAQHFLVDDCTQKISGGEHTMSLGLKVI